MSISHAQKIRSKLKHPIIDGDGHWVETQPILSEYIRQVGGAQMQERYNKHSQNHRNWYDASNEKRQSQRMRRATWWMSPSNTYDRATIMMPSLLRDRMDELGIDFALMYPSLGLTLHRYPGEDFRKAVVQAYNLMARDFFAGYGDRFAPVGVVTAITPQEAIDQLHFAKKECGLKAVMLVGAFQRAIPEFAGGADAKSGVPGKSTPYYIEALGHDNQYDYDPLWQAFQDLGMAVTAHGGSRDWPDRMSWTNDVYNHVEHFANGNHAFAKAVFLGGVVKRFPNLNFAFLEGGMGWATSLCCALQGHWEKRNWPAMQKNLRPSNLDMGELRRLIQQHGAPMMKEKIDEIFESIEWHKYKADVNYLSERETEHYDDFSKLGPISGKRDIREMYAKNFYFGCEADDPTTMFAFDPRLKVRLKAIFSSDIGHWDVHHIDDVVAEVYEALEEGHLTEEDFRDFTFANITHLHGGMNPDFFKGSVVEKETSAELARTGSMGGTTSQSAKKTVNA
jgi:predicted TIM-barrel fold metal-dependent hydrolase